jgi:predicted O-methyltransferase YrrM
VKLSHEEPFDLVFIDADKPSNSIYFSEAKKKKRLVRKVGPSLSPSPVIDLLSFNETQVIVDNVVRPGLVADPSPGYTDEKTEGVRSLLKAMEGDDEVEATTIATVGEKGYDGFIYAFKK